jgi:tRNA 2-thiouridine synthesizing protein A
MYMFDDEPISADDVWDTGDLECGQLLLPLRERVEALRTGGIIRLITRHTSAAMDLRAWCRVTGHRMLRSEPPNFYIQRKQADG